MTAENRHSWSTRALLMPPIPQKGKKMAVNGRRIGALMRAVDEGVVGHDEITSLYGVPIDVFNYWRGNFFCRERQKK
ncbi:MAG: hypothetical protein AAB573_03960 [Patescibacteria group bacterium]